MTLTKELKGHKHAVVSYTSDMNGLAMQIAGILGETEYFAISHKNWLKDLVAYNPTCLWILGHGLSKSTAILDDKSQAMVEIADILAWCESNGIKTVVDTACYPKSRKAIVHSKSPKVEYYCKRNDAVTKKFGNYQTSKYGDMSELEKWWSGEDFIKYHP